MLKIYLTLGTTIGLCMGAFAQSAPPNLPIAVMCYAAQDKSWHAGHLFRVNENGEAIYMSANGKLAATVDAKGVVVKPKNFNGNLDCYGKTLDDLRASGRVLDLKPSR